MSTYNMLIANMRKVFTEMIRYMPDTISLFITFFAVFLAILLGVNLAGDPSTAETTIQYAIVSNAFWFIAMTTMTAMGWEVTTEATRGTLEQLHMSPIGTWKIMLGRMLGNIIANLVIIGLMFFLAMLFTRQWLYLNQFSLVLILIPTLVSMIGVGYIVAGITIIYKQVQSMLVVFQFIFLGMTFVPLSTAPWLELAPFVKGIDVTRHTMMEGSSLAQVPFTAWISLVLNAIFYFLLGLYIFKRCEYTAMKKGLLGQY